MAIRKRLKGFAKRLLGRNEDAPATAPAPPKPRAAAPKPSQPEPAPALHLDTDEDESVDVECDSALVADWIAAGKELLFVDIREIHEIEAGHIEHAHLLPMGDVEERQDELPTDRELVIYCAAGARSYGVAHYLREHGFTAWSMVGGFGSWLACGGDQVIPPRERAFRPVDEVQLTPDAAGRLGLSPDATGTIQEIRDVDGAAAYTIFLGGARVPNLSPDDLTRV